MHQRIGYPKFGAGLAHSAGSIITPIIDEEFGNEVHTLVEFVPTSRST